MCMIVLILRLRYQFVIFTALFLAFQQVEYEVSEGDGMLNNTVFIEKQNGMASEQVLPILALLQPGSAIRGQCIKYSHI